MIDYFVYSYELPEKVGTPGTCCLSVYLKEVKTRNNYGYGSMFGVPFIIQVPRDGLDYEKLYQLVLDRMKRVLKPLEGKESVPSSHARPSSPSNDVAMDENDPSALDAENGNAAMETNGLDNEASHPHLFTMDIVNSSGNTSLGKLKPNGKPISFNGKAIFASSI